jgi:phage shock protein PspC (stress-responsive transcriptional regulator)
MNLSGIIFHIEEDAYEKLNKYLSTIKGYFNATEGRDEIMGDIESRIAEMLQAKVSQTKQAVLLADVESIIAVMGKPEDFASENEQQETPKPQEEQNHRRYRRLFRDPDDKIVGGVCSGIANYFDIDPIWIRAAFAIALFVFGSGVLLYLVLWVIMPEAKTIAEKLQMRGEKVDINSIGKAVNEEFSDVKRRMNKFGERMSSPESRERFRDTTRSLGNDLGHALKSILSVVGKVFSIIFLVLGVILLTGLLAAIFGKGNFMVFDDDSPVRFSIYEIGHSILPSGISSELVITTLILFIGIPLMFIIYRCTKFLFNIQQKNRILNYVASVLWLIGIALVIYIGVMMGTDFSTESYVRKNVSITQPTTKKLFLDVNTLDMDHHRTFIHYGKHGRSIYADNDWTVFSKEDNHYRLGYARLDIVPSETDTFQLVVVKTAHGANREEANNLARNISYEFTQRDSAIVFNNYFDIPDNDKFRAQDVKIILKVPVNGIIYLSNRMGRIIYDIENTNNTLDADMVNRSWIMTNEGLKCMDCTGDEETIDIHGVDDEDGHEKSVIIHKDKNGERIEIEKKGKRMIIHKTYDGDGKIIQEDIEERKDDSDTKDGKKVILNKEIRKDDNGNDTQTHIVIPFRLTPYSYS